MASSPSGRRAQLGIDDSVPPSLTDSEQQTTVEHPLQTWSGSYHEAASESQSMKHAWPERDSHAPGTFTYYNNWDPDSFALDRSDGSFFSSWSHHKEVFS
jgi:hypothetical protein